MVSKKIVLHFSRRLVDRPIVYHLIKDYDLEFNILKAQVTPAEEGMMVLELKGKQGDFDRGIKFLTDTGVVIDALSESILRNEQRCTHCGACVTMCPTGAFELDLVTRKTKFLPAKCIVCGLCIKGCPPRAMELHF
ncbi:MAG: 4Fe-4S binding protein [Dehalococcoidia bacterium]|nr:4Fe-4S binding protein [Dehalococcoidia bacterium]